MYLLLGEYFNLLFHSFAVPSNRYYLLPVTTLLSQAALSICNDFCQHLNNHFYVLLVLLVYGAQSTFLSIRTYCVEQSPSWEASRFAASQEIPRILWNPKVHYRIHKFPLPVCISIQLSPVHTPTSHFLSILILSSHLRLGLPSGLVFRPKPCTRLSPPPWHYMTRQSQSRFYHPHNNGCGVHVS
jgi:hypothetical protein